MPDDNFLISHGYKRLPGYDLLFGSKSGTVCFEVPFDFDLKGKRMSSAVKTESAETAAPSDTYETVKKQQEKLETEYAQRYKNGNYTLLSPYIIQDPYNLSPLSALILFHTEKNTKVRIEVAGKDAYTGVRHEFSEFSTDHQIPVYALYPDYANNITLAITDEEGKQESSVITLQTESLPLDAVKTNIIVKNPMLMAKGFTFFDSPHLNGNYQMAIDLNGDIRWYISNKKLNGSVMTTYLQNGNFLVSSGNVIPNTYNNLSDVYEITALGKYVTRYEVYGIHHDIREKSNGNLLFAASKEGRTSQNDYVVEIDRKTGKVVNSWDFMEIIPMNEYDTDYPYTGGLGNWLHHNALWYDEAQDVFIISGRHQNMIAKIDAKNKKLLWAFSETVGQRNPNLKPFLLAPVGGDFEYPTSQHAVMSLPDGRIMLFDNRNVIEKPVDPLQLDQSLLFSHGTIYSIDETNKTIREDWEYGKNRRELYSSFISDVDYLGENHYLIDFGGIYRGESGENYDHILTPAEVKNASARLSTVIEILNDEVIFEATLYGGESANSYKAERHEVYQNAIETHLK
jgi:hypothetical protein